LSPNFNHFEYVYSEEKCGAKLFEQPSYFGGNRTDYGIWCSLRNVEGNASLCVKIIIYFDNLKNVNGKDKEI
jgi:hypothetical protein